MKLLTSLAAAISFFVVGTKPALADAIWSTGDELVQYWEDQGNRTVIYKKGKNFYIFLDGVKTDLRSNTQLGSYWGYWSDRNSRISCDTYREGFGGRKTYSWGRVRIKYKGRPRHFYTWRAELYECDTDNIVDVLNAIPIVGADSY